jgi:hypothetical protein
MRGGRHYHPDVSDADAPGDSKALRCQAKANRSTRDHWTWFASHRAQIQTLVLPEVGEVRGRLCVLGAGNCNDVDLASLCSAFSEVHLVDVDREALEQAVRRHGVGNDPALHLHGGVDLTGIAERFAAWERQPPREREVLDAARRMTEAAIPQVGGPFDVVLSPCLLSQLCGYAREVLGRQHPRRRDLLVALRTRHLRTVVDLLAPGATAVIVCDVASSTGHPKLLDMHRDRLGNYLDRLTYTERGFDGLTPAAMRDALRGDPLIAPLLGPAQQVAPWLWQLGPGRAFLVYALRFRKLRVPVLPPFNEPRPGR